MEKNNNIEYFDLIIIGAGINGAGIALDAALRGIKVLLLDKRDFGGYTTSASTKLIHGGLRYLEYMEFPLVRESLRERERLLHNAPHLIKPLQLNVPLYKTNKRGPLVIKLGMILYDLLSYDKSLPNHNFHFLQKGGNGFEKGSILRKDDLKAVASYYDCIAQFPERLCLEIVLSAKQNGAVVKNYCEFLSMAKSDDDYHRLTYKDLMSDLTISVYGRVVVNATGPYVDNVNALINKEIKRRMGGTKGSHIIIDKFANGPKEALYIESHQDGRPFFIIPWRDYYLVGTTDIYFEDDFDRVTASEDEVKYLLRELNYYFPKREFVHNDIFYSYSGVRPLPYEPGKKERQITRKHIIVDHSKEKEKIDNYISIVGGKLTTYRSLSEEAVNLICTKLKKDINCRTRNYKLIGAEGIQSIEEYKKEYTAKSAKNYEVPLETADYLIDFYGSNFRDVLNLTISRSDLKDPISSENKDIKAQIIYAIEKEEAKTLEDILIRRTGIGTNKTLGLDCVDDVSKIAAAKLGWNETIRKQNLEKYIENVHFFYEIKGSEKKMETVK